MAEPGQEEGRVQPTQRETRYHGKDKLKGSREPQRSFFKFRTLCCKLAAFLDNKAAGNLISPLSEMQEHRCGFPAAAPLACSNL